MPSAKASLTCPCCSKSVFREARTCLSCGYFEHSEEWADRIEHWTAAAMNSITTVWIPAGAGLWVLVTAAEMFLSNGHHITRAFTTAMTINGMSAATSFWVRQRAPARKLKSARDWTPPPFVRQKTPGGQDMFPVPENEPSRFE